MSTGIEVVLWLILLLQIKHLAADFFLQSAYILNNRYRYGHPGGLLHVGFHLLGSAIAFFVVGASPATLGIILVLEGVFHYHLDWAKDNFVRQRGYTTKDYQFWWTMGIDQALHQASYIGLIWLWLIRGVS